MRLTNYWWLLLWLFTGGLFLAIEFPKRTEKVNGKKVKRWNWLPAILLVLPYVIWAGYRSNQIGDTEAYRSAFWNNPGSLSQLSSYLGSISKDKGFAAYSLILKCIIGNNDTVYFLCIAIFQMAALLYVYRKYSCDLWLSIFLFVASGEYLSWFQNGLRQFMAIAIILFGTDLLVEKKYVPLIGLILLASTFHRSALIMIPIVFIVQGKAWNKKTMICIALTVAVLAFTEQFTNLLDDALTNTQYSNMVTDWKSWGDTGMSPARAIVYCMPMIVSIIGRKQIEEAHDPFIDMMVNFSILSAAFALIAMVTSGIFMGRLVIYSAVYSTALLLPWEVKNIFNRESAAVITVIMIFAYVLFFYYQIHIAWGLM